MGIAVKTADRSRVGRAAAARGSCRRSISEQVIVGCAHARRVDARARSQPRRTPTTAAGALRRSWRSTLSAIGIYGVLAFGVAERVREFGIRQALGADRASILSLVLGQGLRTAGTGFVLGLGGALVADALPAVVSCSGSPPTTAQCSAASPSCCSPSRSWPATFRLGAPPSSILWWLCGILSIANA